MLLALLSIFSGIINYTNSIIGPYGYLAILFLIILSSASLPVSSEVVLLIAGHYVYTGTLNFYLVLITSLAGTAMGIFIDYYIAYFFEKDVVYRHLSTLHIKKSTLVAFDRWFARNGSMAVFVIRLLPLVRSLISFPAGFARMDKKKFFAYSMLGSLIWNTSLILFGEFASTARNAFVLSFYIAVFAAALIVIYYVIMRHVKKR